MKLLIIDSDPKAVESVELTAGLAWPRATTLVASRGDAGINAVDSGAPMLVVLEANLPDLSGFRVCRQIRQYSNVPIIMLSNRDKEADIVRGLDAGADDYIVKPANPLVFIARANAVLRRSYLQPFSETTGFKYGELEIDFETAKVTLAKRPVKLTTTEYKLLIQLVKNAGRIVPRWTLIDLVWGRKNIVDSHCLKVCIARLRKKLEEDAVTPKYIITERSRGYGFPRGPARESPIIQGNSDIQDLPSSSLQ